MPLTLTPLPGIPLIRPGDNLADILLHSIELANLQLADGDILVLAQKIVSKAEGRIRNLTEVCPSARALELADSTQKDPRLLELILGESRAVLRTRPAQSSSSINSASSAPTPGLTTQMFPRSNLRRKGPKIGSCSCLKTQTARRLKSAPGLNLPPGAGLGC